MDIRHLLPALDTTQARAPLEMAASYFHRVSSWTFMGAHVQVGGAREDTPGCSATSLLGGDCQRGHCLLSPATFLAQCVKFRLQHTNANASSLGCCKQVRASCPSSLRRCRVNTVLLRSLQTDFPAVLEHDYSYCGCCVVSSPLC